MDNEFIIKGKLNNCLDGIMSYNIEYCWVNLMVRKKVGNVWVCF